LLDSLLQEINGDNEDKLSNGESCKA